ncbi:hypothetical protein EON81_17875 [bacterium]|nr:MAG: hypothetical protein EON81_17875 [bacterium]
MAAEILLTSVVAAILAAGATKPTEVKLLDYTTGNDSNMSTAAIKLARSPEAWQRIWKEHAVPEVDLNSGTRVFVRPSPSIPFDKVMVLAVFDGLTNPRRWALASSKTEKDTVTLRLRPVNLSTAGLDVNLTPYTFLFLTRTNSRVVIEIPDRDTFVPIAEFPKVESKKVPAAAMGG